MMTLNKKKSAGDSNKEEGKSDEGSEGNYDMGSVDILAELDDIESEDDESGANDFVIKQELLIGYLDDAKVVEENDLTPNVRKQYTSSNVAFVYWLFDHGCQDLFFPEIWSELIVLKKRKSKDFVKTAIRDWLSDKSKCPIKLQQMTYNNFFSYICSIKRDDNTYFSFSCYESKKTALTYLYTSFGFVQSEVFKTRLKKAFSSLRKTIKKMMKR